MVPLRGDTSLFPSADDETFAYIKKAIDNCDYFVLIIGGKYGSLHRSGKSFTQMEYEYALRKNIPAIAFVRANLDSLESSKYELDEKKRKKLNEFKSLVKKRLVRYWTTKGELAAIVSRSIVHLMKNNPGKGWVRQDKVKNSGNIRNADIFDILQDIKKSNTILFSQLPRERNNIRIGGNSLKLIELQVLSLGSKADDNLDYAVFLGREDSPRVLPIVLGGFDAQSIALELEKRLSPKPSFHRFFYNCLEAMKIEIKELAIYNIREGVFDSKITLSNGYDTVDVAARTSAVITLALIDDKPIMCDKSVFHKASVSKIDLPGVQMELEPIKDRYIYKKIFDLFGVKRFHQPK